MVSLPGQPKGQWHTSHLAIASLAVDGSKELLGSRCSLGASPERERQHDREHKVAGIKSKYGAVWGISLKVGFHLVFCHRENGDRLGRL